MTGFTLLDWMIDIANKHYWFTIASFQGYGVPGTALLHIASHEGEVWLDFLWFAGLRSLFT